MEQLINNIDTQIKNITTQILSNKGARDQVIKIKDEELERLNQYKVNQKNSHLAYIFLSSEIIQRRDEVIEAIEKVATIALQMIYGEEYCLEFNKFEEKRRDGNIIPKMEINVQSTIEDKKLITGIEDQRGGGLAEIIAFSLRMAALDWLKYEGPLILDESYKSMSEDEKILNVASILKEFTKITGRQLIFATHKAIIFGSIADKIIQVYKEDGMSKHKYIEFNKIEKSDDNILEIEPNEEQ